MTAMHQLGAAADYYVMSIKLPRSLVRAIDSAAAIQYRTTASLVRETLAKRFLPDSPENVGR